MGPGRDNRFYLTEQRCPEARISLSPLSRACVQDGPCLEKSSY